MNTKMISRLGLGFFAALAFASCDHIEESLSQPITNPQEPMFESANIVYNPAASIDAVNPEAGEVQVATFTAEGLPEGYSVEGILELSNSSDFAKMIETPLTSVDGVLYANVGDIAAQYTDNFTKNPAEVDLYGRTILNAVKGTDKYRLGTIDTYYGVGTYKFIPAAPDHVIAPAYYIVMGDGSDWDLAAAVKMEHADGNQYDDPKFGVVVNELSAKGDKWVVLGEDDYNKAKGAGSLAAVECLVPVYDRTEGGTKYGDFEKVSDGSFIAASMPSMTVPSLVSLNAQTYTYTSMVAVEKYYVTGDGWSNWGNFKWMPLFSNNYTDYYGFLNLGTQFKFSPNAAWNGDFGAANAPEATEKDGVYTFTGVCHDDKENIVIDVPGLYFGHLNGVTWEYDLHQIKSWGMIGDFNGWGGDVVMTPSEDLYVWTAELTVETGQGWKFRTNGSWDGVNLGGQPNELWNNGDNIVLPEAGTYTITLDLTTYPSKFTAVKK